MKLISKFRPSHDQGVEIRDSTPRFETQKDQFIIARPPPQNH